MTISVKHSTTATAADDPDAEINKAEWNAEHTYTMATGKLLGRGTAGTGDVEEITLGTNLSFSGTTLNAAGGGGGALDDLSDVVITSPSNTQVLKYNGTNWVNAADATGGGGGGTPVPGLISGLQLTWVSVSAVDVGTGMAYIESLADYIAVSSVINITGISLGNNAWGYVYLDDDGATAECVTTAPAAAYSGTARSKTGDNTKRFLGAVRTDGSGNIYRFYHTPTRGFFRYQAVDTGASPFRILSNGSATSSTAVSAAAVVPPQSRMFSAVALNLNTGQGLYMGMTGYTVSTSQFELLVSATGSASTMTASSKPFNFITDTSQQINYLMTGAGGGAYIDVDGFFLER